MRGTPAPVRTDNGDATETAVAALSGREIDVLVAVGTEARRRPHDVRPLPESTGPPTPPKAPWLVATRKKLSQADHRARYRRRQQTVEPVFGIMKHVLGFRQFLLRGHEQVTGEWQLLALAYNCQRLPTLQGGQLGVECVH